MKKEDVPQDNSRSYGGHKKIIYATTSSGKYEKTNSSGWEAEEFVTLMAVTELETQARAAYKRLQNGETSPLEYHMYNSRMDLLGLSQATGLFQWQIKRHFNLINFTNISPKIISLYTQALGITKVELQATPTRASSDD